MTNEMLSPNNGTTRDQINEDGNVTGRSPPEITQIFTQTTSYKGGIPPGGVTKVGVKETTMLASFAGDKKASEEHHKVGASIYRAEKTSKTV